MQMLEEEKLEENKISKEAFIKYQNDACYNLQKRMIQSQKKYKSEKSSYEIARYWVSQYLEFDKDGKHILKAQAEGNGFYNTAAYLLSLLAMATGVLSFGASTMGYDGLSGYKWLSLVLFIVTLVFLAIIIKKISLEKWRKYILEVLEEME